MRVAASAGDVMSSQSEGLDQSRCLSESKVTFKVTPKKKKKPTQWLAKDIMCRVQTVQ